MILRIHGTFDSYHCEEGADGADDQKTHHVHSHFVESEEDPALGNRGDAVGVEEVSEHEFFRFGDVRDDLEGGEAGRRASSVLVI